MAEYNNLALLLQRMSASHVRLTFDEVAAAVPGGLPPSAYQYTAWWSNEAAGRHVQAQAWLGSGWRVEAIDLVGCTVTFSRTAIRS